MKRITSSHNLYLFFTFEIINQSFDLLMYVWYAFFFLQYFWHMSSWLLEITQFISMVSTVLYFLIIFLLFLISLCFQSGVVFWALVQLLGSSSLWNKLFIPFLTKPAVFWLADIHTQRVWTGGGWGLWHDILALVYIIHLQE